jgi:hypothetical protein
VHFKLLRQRITEWYSARPGISFGLQLVVWEGKKTPLWQVRAFFRKRNIFSDCKTLTYKRVRAECQNWQKFLKKK